MRKEGINFRTTAEFETVRTIKEKACYLASNPLKEETVETEHLNYTLPDGNSIQIGPARFRAPEVLFRPDLIGEECEGLHEVLMFSIQKSDLDLRKVLFKNIVLSGGSTLFKVGLFLRESKGVLSFCVLFRDLVIDCCQKLRNCPRRMFRSKYCFFSYDCFVSY